MSMNSLTENVLLLTQLSVSYDVASEPVRTHEKVKCISSMYMI